MMLEHIRPLVYSLIRPAVPLCLAAAISLPAEAAPVELLPDPSLEASTGPASNPFWTLTFNSPAGPAAVFEEATFASFPAAADEYGLWFRSFEGDAAGTRADASLETSVPIVAGESYTFSGHFKVEQGFAANALQMIFGFLDAADGILASSTTDLLLQPHDGDWHQNALGLIAPAGAVSAFIQVDMVGAFNSAQNPQSAMVDAFSIVGEPTTPIPLPGGLPLLATALLIAGLRRGRS